MTTPEKWFERVFRCKNPGSNKNSIIAYTLRRITDKRERSVARKYLSNCFDNWISIRTKRQPIYKKKYRTAILYEYYNIVTSFVFSKSLSINDIRYWSLADTNFFLNVTMKREIDRYNTKKSETRDRRQNEKSIIFSVTTSQLAISLYEIAESYDEMVEMELLCNESTRSRVKSLNRKAKDCFGENDWLYLRDRLRLKTDIVETNNYPYVDNSIIRTDDIDICSTVQWRLFSD